MNDPLVPNSNGRIARIIVDFSALAFAYAPERP